MALLITTAGYSQDKGYIGLTFGAANPIGDYHSTDIDNDDAGLAKTGLFYDLSFAYKFGGSFGLTAVLRGQANPVNADEFASQVEDEFASVFGPGLSVKAESDPWSCGLFMAGGYGSFGLTDKLSFESRILIGLMSATAPEMTATVTDGIDSYWEKQSAVTSTGFAFGVGAGLKFDVGNRICLLANLDYTSATVSFEDVEYISSDGDNYTDSFDQSLSTVNFGVGIGYRL